MSEGFLSELNAMFLPKARLGIMTLLLTWQGGDFAALKAQLQLTDGNLGAHLRALEDAGYLSVEKGFVGRKPRTVYQVTESGRQAFLSYLDQLESVVRMVKPERPD